MLEQILAGGRLPRPTIYLPAFVAGTHGPASSHTQSKEDPAVMESISKPAPTNDKIGSIPLKLASMGQDPGSCSYSLGFALSRWHGRLTLPAAILSILTPQGSGHDLSVSLISDGNAEDTRKFGRLLAVA
jgi:hypothetical protein